MKLIYVIIGLTAGAALPVASSGATLPTPAAANAPREAQAFLFNAGAGDIFEITTSTMAIQHSQNPQVRSLATMIIADHTNLTNTALGAAASAGVMAPPPELSAQQKGQIGQLISAGPADFDRVYLSQQLPAHEMALQLMQGYAAGGDVPQLRQAAAGAVPIVQKHLGMVQQMLGAMR